MAQIKRKMIRNRLYCSKKTQRGCL